MLKVVVIEDEDLIRKGLIYTFDWLKFDCVVIGEGANGVEGKALIEENQPDIVVTDIRMPLMNGLDMIADYKERRFEVVIITGHAEFEYARKAIDYGVNYFVLKPIDHKELEAIIEEVVAKIRKKKTIASIQDKIKDLKDYDLMDIEFYCNRSNYTHRYTSEAINYISENYDRKITSEEVADYLKISKSQLRKGFKEDTQHTFNDFLNKYRIQTALRLMFMTDMRIYEIAEKVGYSEYKYFSQVFKNYMNHTPTEFLQIQTFIHKENEGS